jgi:hypothetical protein
MNEFEWRRQLQQLRQPMMPQRDLWPAIDKAMKADVADASDVPPRHRADRAQRPRWFAAAGLAAALVLFVGVGWQLSRESTSAVGDTMAARWKPADPRLAGAAIELDAARMELQQAMLQAPDSPALRRLLVRTERQQTQLHQLTGQAG